MRCRPSFTKSFFFALLLLLFSVSISSGAEYYILSGFIADANSSGNANEWHVVARETSNANPGNDVYSDVYNSDPIAFYTYEMALFPWRNYNVRCESFLHVNNCTVVLSSPVQNIDFPQDTVMHFSIPAFDNNLLCHITGSVVDDLGAGIPLVDVSASSDDGACTSSSQSDGDGTFDLTVIPGTYTILFSAPAQSTYLNRGMTIDITGDRQLPDTTLNSIDNYFLSGFFLDEYGAHSLDGYDSALINAYNASIIHSTWKSTTDGNFFFYLFAGGYTITAELYDDYNNGNSQSTAYQVFDYLQPPHDNSLGIPLPSEDYYLLEGTVTDNEGIALPDVRIDASGHDGACSGWSYTDSQGYYVLRLMPGQYTVTAAAPPSPATYPPYRINNITIPGDGDCQRDIRLFSDDTILKEALDLLDGSLGIALDVFDIINQGNTLSYDIEVTGSGDLLEIILNWNWADSQVSQMSMEIRDPDGTLFDNRSFSASQPPIIVDIPDPAQGTWTCSVTADLAPSSNYPFALVAGVTQYYSLNASVSGGHGTVLPVSGTYSRGTVVNLTAAPDSGYRVRAWHGTSNDASTSNANSVTMTADHTITVEFEPIPSPPAPTTYTLNASVGSGNGTIRPAFGTYSHGAVVTLSAVPGAGYQVKAWHGTNNDASTSNTNSVTMSTNRTVTVDFEIIPAPPVQTSFTLSASVINGHGTVSVSPSSGPYLQGTMVSLSAAPENGYKVKAWSGTDDDTSTAASNTATMNADRFVSVEFMPISNSADNEEESGGGGGGGGCFISASSSGLSPMPVIPLTILIGITFMGMTLFCIMSHRTE